MTPSASDPANLDALGSGRGHLVVDTSALLRRYLADRHHRFVVDTMDATEVWVSSAMTRSEVMLALHHTANGPVAQQQLWAHVAHDWELFWTVPVDGRCLGTATEIGARYGITLSSAINLTAADRLPQPVKFLTFDRHQIPAAADMGFEVASPLV